MARRVEVLAKKFWVGRLVGMGFGLGKNVRYSEVCRLLMENSVALTGQPILTDGVLDPKKLLVAAYMREEFWAR